ncbi:hypothetical protein [Acholeplasma hippikon]|uniref:TPM domain-containing protein n=2 Tax=Acholeplasma hippikon TaxID=264636 RepID=A0A449BJ46_9MOLU|nr:hypothetical protein [Acholeplasma hippikon]VEU82462.1 Uncharacterised protein [Acholeplasma hippikon]
MIFILSACQQPYTSLNQPTSEFYINDAAGALLQSTKWYIFSNGQYYYEDTMTYEGIEDDELRGIQIVVATHLGAVGSIDTTAIFNSYGVGGNDLGIMIFLFFEEINGTKVYKEMVFEIGTRMSTYLSAFEADMLIEEYFNDPTLDDIDERIVNLYFELIANSAYKIYNWSYSYIDQTYYDIYDFFGEKYSITTRLPSEEQIWAFTLSPTETVILIVIAVFFLGAFGRFLVPIILSMMGVTKNRGSGGTSRGYWFRK